MAEEEEETSHLVLLDCFTAQIKTGNPVKTSEIVTQTVMLSFQGYILSPLTCRFMHKNTRAGVKMKNGI